MRGCARRTQTAPSVTIKRDAELFCDSSRPTITRRGLKSISIINELHILHSPSSDSVGQESAETYKSAPAPQRETRRLELGVEAPFMISLLWLCAEHFQLLLSFHSETRRDVQVKLVHEGKVGRIRTLVAANQPEQSSPSLRFYI